MRALYNVSIVWEVEYTDEFEEWWDSLFETEQERITAAIEVLGEVGPTLGRPLVDTVQHSRHANMKELRPPASTIRILFAFDPRRAAILLLGGDKTGQWNFWYATHVPIADALYDAHLTQVRKES